MASNALLSRDTTTADQWLTIAQRLSGSKSQVEYLLAKKTRMDRSFIDMTSHLKAALKQGVDPDLLEKEQVLANVSLGEIDSLSESRVKRWIAEKGPDVGDVVDAYANGLARLSRFEDASSLLEAYEREFSR